MKDALEEVGPLGSSSLFSQAAEVADPKGAWKWDAVIEAGVTEYMRANPERVQRRVRRGIPQCYRWQVWKARAERSGCQAHYF